MHRPLLGLVFGPLLAATFVLTSADALMRWTRVPNDPRADASTWYTFAAEGFSRTDGATALYESTRRQAGHAARRAGGPRASAVQD